MSITIVNDPRAHISANTILVEVTTRRHGNSATVEFSALGDAVSVDADTDMLAVRKKLLDSPQWREVAAYDHATYRWLNKRGLKANLRAGVYRLPLPLLSEIESGFQLRAKEREKLVEAFILAAPALQKEAAKKLRRVYNPADYPTPERMRDNYAFSWRYVAQGVPSQLATLVPEAHERQLRQDEHRTRQELDAMRFELRTRAATLVAKLLERLTPHEKGGEKRFESTTVDNLNEFLTLFDHLNIAGDQALGGVVQTARTALEGVSADAIRTNEAVRQRLRAAAKTLDCHMADLLPALAHDSIRQSVQPKYIARKFRDLD